MSALVPTQHPFMSSTDSFDATLAPDVANVGLQLNSTEPEIVEGMPQQQEFRLGVHR